MPFFKSIRWRVFLCTALCVAAVGLVSNLYIYQYLNGIITERAYSIDTLNRRSIAQQLNAELEKALTLSVQCANHVSVLRAAEAGTPSSNAQMTVMLDAQQVMADATAVSGVDNYLNKMMLYNREGLLVQSSRQRYPGFFSDWQNLLNSPAYQTMLSTGILSNGLTLMPTSITPYQEQQCLAAVQPVTSGAASSAKAWLYTEFSTDLVTDVLDNYMPSGEYFVTTANGAILPGALDEALPTSDVRHLQSGDTFAVNGDTWRVEITPLDYSGMQLVSCVNESALLLDNQKIFHTVLVALLASIVAGIAILALVSGMLTKPVLRLTARIKRISENDFDYDPTIEKGSDEIAQIGRVVNEMILSVRHLLQETQQQAEQKRKIELAMLQSQVNPHFLYNTLDSIHWMAVIQKNPGIQQMARSLSNLLKHMAKGYNHKIPLAEEISLLEDYIGIMSIRYMDTFEFVNDINPALYKYSIIKLTLQPLVENAIFHGIEPTGRFGTIRLYAQEKGDDLLITVEDDGQGMDQAAIQRALHSRMQHSHGSMNGIGVSNVNERLRLVYGAPYGLSIDARPGQYTRMTVRIPKEEAN